MGKGNSIGYMPDKMPVRENVNNEEIFYYSIKKIDIVNRKYHILDIEHVINGIDGKKVARNRK
jgi:hypothetical protein